jgi:methylated-DNA-[protein]-cysteine S-methyltransferase
VQNSERTSALFTFHFSFLILHFAFCILIFVLFALVYILMPQLAPTAFETRVYDLILTIPKGKVSTYALVAKELGCGSNQAVGQALRRNPFAPRVPCHRVVSAALSLGGFNGHRDGEELARKRRMLEEEGVKFDAQGRVYPSYIYSFQPDLPGELLGGIKTRERE